MLRMKVTVVSLVVLGALIFGSVVAYAGWGWNAKVDVNGTLISTGWTAKHNHSGPPEYFAKITVVVPNEAKVSLVEAAKNESVNIVHSADLACTRSGIQTTVIYVVENTGADDTVGRVRVVVSTVDKHKRLATASGALGEEISVDVVVPGRCTGA